MSDQVSSEKSAGPINAPTGAAAMDVAATDGAAFRSRIRAARRPLGRWRLPPDRIRLLPKGQRARDRPEAN
jgi:hypothetical protein